MKATIFRNTEKLNDTQILDKFVQSLGEFEEFSQSEIEMLAEAYAKNPVDKFIVAEFPTVEVAQGDILIWAKGTEQYNKNIKTVHGLTRTERLVLQEGDSMTGDHRVVPLNGAKVVVKKGSFQPEILADADLESGRSYNCLTLSSDKPFLVVHREHGNIALPGGEYMVCTALDVKTLTRMLD